MLSEDFGTTIWQHTLFATALAIALVPAKEPASLESSLEEEADGAAVADGVAVGLADQCGSLAQQSSQYSQWCHARHGNLVPFRL